MLDVHQLGILVVRPTLNVLNMGGEVAEALILGTAAQESGFRYLHQLGQGPALGLWQMEPATERDLWSTYLDFRLPLAAKVRALLAPWPDRTEQLVTNLAYACAMARLRFWRARAPLPDHLDLEELAEIYKTHYNTAGGAATPAEWLANYRRLVAPAWGTP